MSALKLILGVVLFVGAIVGMMYSMVAVIDGSSVGVVFLVLLPLVGFVGGLLVRRWFRGEVERALAPVRGGKRRGADTSKDWGAGVIGRTGGAA